MKIDIPQKDIDKLRDVDKIIISTYISMIQKQLSDFMLELEYMKNKLWIIKEDKHEPRSKKKL